MRIQTRNPYGAIYISTKHVWRLILALWVIILIGLISHSFHLDWILFIEMAVVVAILSKIIDRIYLARKARQNRRPDNGGDGTGDRARLQPVGPTRAGANEEAWPR